MIKYLLFTLNSFRLWGLPVILTIVVSYTNCQGQFNVRNDKENRVLLIRNWYGKEIGGVNYFSDSVSYYEKGGNLFVFSSFQGETKLERSFIIQRVFIEKRNEINLERLYFSLEPCTQPKIYENEVLNNKIASFRASFDKDGFFWSCAIRDKQLNNFIKYDSNSLEKIRNSLHDTFDINDTEHCRVLHTDLSSSPLPYEGKMSFELTEFVKGKVNEFRNKGYNNFLIITEYLDLAKDGKVFILYKHDEVFKTVSTNFIGGSPTENEITGVLPAGSVKTLVRLFSSIKDIQFPNNCIRDGSRVFHFDVYIQNSENVRVEKTNTYCISEVLKTSSNYPELRELFNIYYSPKYRSTH